MEHCSGATLLLCSLSLRLRPFLTRSLKKIYIYILLHQDFINIGSLGEGICDGNTVVLVLFCGFFSSETSLLLLLMTRRVASHALMRLQPLIIIYLCSLLSVCGAERTRLSVDLTI